MKTLYWMGDSLDRLGRFPSGVKQEVGYALYLAQEGDKHPHAKPLREFTGAGTLESYPSIAATPIVPSTQ